LTSDSVRKRRITVHGQQVTEQDWRGFLAILTTLGYLVLVAITTLRHSLAETMTAASILSTPEMLVLSWYFRAKEAEG
jgi:hypothetical protein